MVGNYIIYFDIAAIILSFMLLLIIWMRRSYSTKAFKIYNWMLVLNLVAAVFDIISAYTIANPENFNEAFCYLINMVYLTVHNLTAILFLMYIIVFVRGNFGMKHEIAIYAIAAIFEISAIFTTPFTQFIIYYDANQIYTHGPGMILLYGISFFIIIYATVMVIWYRKILSTFQLMTDIVFVLLLLCAVIYQAFFPGFLIETFCAAIAFLMMNVSLDNPATYMYRSSNCYNQNAFIDHIQDQIKRGVPFNLVGFNFDDIEVFKRVYDPEEYYHLINTTIQLCHREYGRNFTFILEDGTFVIYTYDEDPSEIIAELTSKLSKPFELKGGENITMSPHFCILRYPSEARTPKEMVILVQDMLNGVYRETSLRVVWDSSKLVSRKQREDYVVHILRKAIRDDGFEIYYQPIYDPVRKGFFSAEALVRLKDSNLKIYPDEFIPIAEKNGIILDMGEMVIKKVCHFIRSSQCIENGLDHISVNLSVLQLIRRSAVERIVYFCDMTNVNTKNIMLEVTETATESLDDNSGVLNNLSYLYERGFRFALDDYGSGYSNMVHLMQFPFEQVKIDKSILWRAVENAQAKKLLQYTVNLIRDFNFSSVAEGVETETMCQTLTEMGVDYFQGYYYSKPMPESEFRKFLSSECASSRSVFI